MNILGDRLNFSRRISRDETCFHTHVVAFRRVLAIGWGWGLGEPLSLLPACHLTFTQKGLSRTFHWAGLYLSVSLLISD